METDEVLETGNGPGTPRGDNLLNDFVQGEADAWKALSDARGDRIVEDERFGMMMADGASPSVFGNPVILRRPLRDAEWPEAARVMHEFFAAGHGGAFLVFSAWPTPDVRDLGFGLVGHPPVMERPAGPLDAGGVPGLDVRPVEDAEAAAEWERVLVEGYPVPELQPFAPGSLLPAQALAAPGWRHWVGRLDGAPVATASAFVDERHVRVEFISALAECRGRGVGAAMTATATLADPSKAAVLIASDLSRGVYRRLGYRSVLRFTLWAGHRGAIATL